MQTSPSLPCMDMAILLQSRKLQEIYGMHAHVRLGAWEGGGGGANEYGRGVSTWYTGSSTCSGDAVVVYVMMFVL